HFAELKKAKFDTVILQYSQSGNMEEMNVYYPTEKIEEFYDGTIYSLDLIGNLLNAAEKAGFKVYIGLSCDDNWWTKSANGTYTDYLAQLDCTMIDEINALYGDKECFIGWYWAYEITNLQAKSLKTAPKMLNAVIDKLNSIGDNRPLMVSPYTHWVEGMSGDYETDLENWSTFFNNVNFRAGDIFSPQDGVGKTCGGIMTDEAREKNEWRLKSYYDAVKTKDGLKLYVNCEFFGTDKPCTLNTDPIYCVDFSRAKEQIEMAKVYAEKLVTFSYSHYCVPSQADIENEYAVGFHDKYVEYVGALYKLL
ncbi:MAG: DUF4434 domain-containing protein, partial [Clostridia bacterium]|nr:DUF4434 domain-containing protein [Clostridia bacterium]